MSEIQRYDIVCPSWGGGWDTEKKENGDFMRPEDVDARLAADAEKIRTLEAQATQDLRVIDRLRCELAGHTARHNHENPRHECQCRSCERFREALIVTEPHPSRDLSRTPKEPTQ